MKSLTFPYALELTQPVNAGATGSEAGIVVVVGPIGVGPPFRRQLIPAKISPAEPGPAITTGLDPLEFATTISLFWLLTLGRWMYAIFVPSGDQMP